MASNENIPEISLTATEFRGRLKSAYQDGGVKAPRKIQQLGVFRDGARYVVEDGMRNVVFYLVTDLGLLISTGDALIGIVGANSSRATVSTASPGNLTSSLSVKFPVGAGVSLAPVTGILSGRTSCANGSATQVTSQLGAFNNMMVKNLDAVNAIELGAAGFTGGTGYPLETLGTSDDSVWLRNITPSLLYGAGIGAAVTIAWLLY